jgi:hypothetical protein
MERIPRESSVIISMWLSDPAFVLPTTKGPLSSDPDVPCGSSRASHLLGTILHWPHWWVPDPPYIARPFGIYRSLDSRTSTAAGKRGARGRYKDTRQRGERGSAQRVAVAHRTNDEREDCRAFTPPSTVPNAGAKKKPVMTPISKAMRSFLRSRL